MTKFDINKAEAGAFCTHAAMRGLSTIEALNELARTTWTAKGGRNQGAIKRLAKPLLFGLDAQNESRKIFEAAIAADKIAILAASPERIETVKLALVAGENRKAKALARKIGVVRSAADAELLATTMFNTSLGGLRYESR